MKKYCRRVVDFLNAFDEDVANLSEGIMDKETMKFHLNHLLQHPRQSEKKQIESLVMEGLEILDCDCNPNITRLIEICRSITLQLKEFIIAAPVPPLD